MPRKRDADAIEAFWDRLVEEQRTKWSGADRADWPPFLFHITDIRNVLPILDAGKLLPRSTVTSSKQMLQDTSAPDIIAKTPPAVRDRVRLYFRPKTPVFYHSEGIRTEKDRSRFESNCPLPVTFLFDAKRVLTEEGTIYSNGNASSYRASFGPTASFLSALPFDSVYHDGSMPEREVEELKFRTCAEVLATNHLQLSGSLKRIFVRSQGEYETLQSLIRTWPKTIDERYLRSIQVNTKTSLFFRQWTYVESVEVLRDTITVRFNSSTKSPGPYLATLRFEEIATRNTLFEQSLPNLMARGSVRHPLPVNAQSEPFRLVLFLDEWLAYQNEFSPPFDYALLGPH